MGLFSKVQRFHEAGSKANKNNVKNFGKPDYSLFTSAKLITMHKEIDIMDANERVVYKAKSKMISIKDKTDIVRASGEQVAHIERKVMTLHEAHFITMADGQKFEMSNEIMHIIKDVTNIKGLGWQLKGNILGLNFELYDASGKIVAVIGQKMISIHDKYCIDIYQRQYEEIVVAILITLQHMIRDRENAASAADFSD